MYDEIGTRMKENYENRSKSYLLRRVPVIIRIDGKAFHTLTRNLCKPFDDFFISAMQNTALNLCKEIQGCKIAYTQSDEISLLLIDYDKLTTSAWFDYSIQKMTSISASIATYYFNHFINEILLNKEFDLSKFGDHVVPKEIYLTEMSNPGLFDSRCFNMPREEVTNYFLWRQLDASRNSIMSLAQSLYCHKELIGINCNDLQNKMLIEKNVNWNDLPIIKKRGTCIIKDENENWIIDHNIPLFNENRDYINNYVYIDV